MLPNGGQHLHTNTGTHALTGNTTYSQKLLPPFRAKPRATRQKKKSTSGLEEH